MNQKLKLHQLSLPDYDNLKDNLHRILDCLNANNFLEIHAKAALLALSIMFKVELESLLSMWNSISSSKYTWITSDIETEEVHTEMIRQFISYLDNNYEIKVTKLTK